MSDTQYLDKFEANLNRLLNSYMQRHHLVDEILPDAPDIEGMWEGICMDYLGDGVREFADYPMVSLGWMMFIGMGVARKWDEDWIAFLQVDDPYTKWRDARGYDNLDDYICYDVLGLDEKQAESLSAHVADAAQITYRALRNEGFEPGTALAFKAYLRCLRQMYFFGAAMELRRLGYHMTALPLN